MLRICPFTYSYKRNALQPDTKSCHTDSEHTFEDSCNHSQMYAFSTFFLDQYFKPLEIWIAQTDLRHCYTAVHLDHFEFIFTLIITSGLPDSQKTWKSNMSHFLPKILWLDVWGCLLIVVKISLWGQGGRINAQRFCVQSPMSVTYLLLNDMNSF